MLRIFRNSSLKRSVVSPPRRVQRRHFSMPSPFAYLEKRARKKGLSNDEYARDIMGWVVVGCAGLVIWDRFSTAREIKEKVQN
ncbi:hypothetical protein JCM10296v2_006594 [Rhodotorula toruloides]